MPAILRDLLVVFPILILSAALEVGGDAGMRFGLQKTPIGFVIGAILLIVYGLVVNMTKLDFSKLMGIYIAIFFVVSQIISVAIFHDKLRPPVLVGGAFIVVGGLVMTFWTSK